MTTYIHNQKAFHSDLVFIPPHFFFLFSFSSLFSVHLFQKYCIVDFLLHTCARHTTALSSNCYLNFLLTICLFGLVCEFRVVRCGGASYQYKIYSITSIHFIVFSIILSRSRTFFHSIARNNINYSQSSQEFVCEKSGKSGFLRNREKSCKMVEKLVKMGNSIELCEVGKI